MYYHIVTNIDGRFKSAAEVLAAYQGKTIQPIVPYSAMRGEDKTTPRICVCKDIKDCVTAIGLLGRFRRCLAANEDAKSYETDGIEVYPILILGFPDGLDYYEPDGSEVPDVAATHEMWLLEPATPSLVQLAWVHPRSIIWESCDLKQQGVPYTYMCKSIEFLIANDRPIGRIHPWLTGTGHVMDSSQMEDEYDEN